MFNKHDTSQNLKYNKKGKSRADESKSGGTGCSIKQAVMRSLSEKKLFNNHMRGMKETKEISGRIPGSETVLMPLCTCLYV